MRIHSLLALLKPLDPSGGGGIAADWAPVDALAANVSGGVWFDALDAAMDHELFDVARAIERRMLTRAGFA